MVRFHAASGQPRAGRARPWKATAARAFLRGMADDAVRTLERALAASPGDRALRERLASALVRRGERPRACAVLGMRWDVDLAALPPLEWRGELLAQDAVAALVAEDLATFDPVALAAAFPRRGDGAWHGNRTRFLRRYAAHQRRAPYRRLVLVAWTAGTANGHDAPGLITVTLDTRSTFRAGKLLPESAWRSP